MIKRDSQSPGLPLSTEDSVFKWFSRCHCKKKHNSAFSWIGRKKRHQVGAIGFINRGEVIDRYRHNVWFVYPTGCPSHRHFIKVIIVLIVLFLSPVVTGAGLGSGHAVIGRDDPPSCHGASVSGVRACAATSLFWYFIYSRNPRWLLWMSQSHSKLRMQVAAEKQLFPDGRVPWSSIRMVRRRP